MKPTPGPWHVFFNTKKPMVRAESKRMIAQIIPHPGDAPIPQLFSAEDEANVKLIAAAPEMYDALGSVFVRLTFEHVTDWREERRIIGEMIGRALKKAEGKS